MNRASDLIPRVLRSVEYALVTEYIHYTTERSVC